MGRGNAATDLGLTRRPKKTKSRTGCRTCKIRKVKCDEGWPTCHRCASTGRTCDGYGIWGGGDNPRSQGGVSGQNNHPVLRLTTPASPRVLDAAERDCFEWFTLISAKKLRGIFSSAFWDKLVFQASFDEPAVLHAVLAIGSIQRQEMAETRDVTYGFMVPNDDEQFMLRHYSKAIGHLVAQSQVKDQPSVDAVLLTCLLFIFLEFLRGHYKNAQTHLGNGLKLIRQAGCSLSKSGKSNITLSPRHRIDRDILETFSRVQVQVGLLRPLDQYFESDLVFEAEPVTGTFKSIEQARESLDRLINEALQLTEGCRQDGVDESSHQQRIRTGLDAWYNTYSLSTVNIDTTMSFMDKFGYRLLQAYYTMARWRTAYVELFYRTLILDICRLIAQARSSP
ncbi:hypothetical protein G7Z17_g930 [Cylindrodendrum hubeiense]|uniref:Zn(2)-C6 fungal-type domain-containing protein n=1 Tax=Cylindrodendrum hubeiense TaxID=595255 RepID=A0A9P5HKL1_9HYPO|nr:hypothetical protein G7Z17_g930 [Cylindrodendrum hubeiense]